MAEAAAPSIYSIAAHRGFADALVAGLVPRYSEGELGLARLTLLVPSSRAARTLADAFIRHSGDTGLLRPRMVTVGDLDLDEALGNLLDPLGATDVPPAVEPTRRWLELADLLDEAMAAQGKPPLPGAARLRMARDIARTIDRLLVEEKSPGDLIDPRVLDLAPNLARHWEDSIRLFAQVHTRWQFTLGDRGEVDAATRRNLLFDRATARWRANPPPTPIVAAGVTSAAPALARMLRAIANLPRGAVILPDLDLAMDKAAWDELGRAGMAPEPGETVFAQGDALTHPQYHLKLLLGRMGIAREEVRPWHRKGASASEPDRSRAISSLFLPPQASQTWVHLGPDNRRLSGVRLLTSATGEEEAQAIALLVREALEEPEKRVAVVTADRALARRVVQHLERWNIAADDSAGRALSLTPAGRLLALLAEIVSHGLPPAGLIALLAHPLVHSQDGEKRAAWLRALRTFDRALRGPTPPPGLAPLRRVAAKAELAEWWQAVEAVVEPLLFDSHALPFASLIDAVVVATETLAGEAVWAREDGRALAAMVEDLRLHARDVGTMIEPRDLAGVLRDAMDEIAVRPPYGGHPRVAIYGLLESRMTRADLVVCGGLNEGSWPQAPAPDALLAPGVLRALGVPGAEFRIGLSAHDLAGAMGAPEVVLSRAQRDADGPTRPSRFLLRVEALLGDLATDHREERIPAILPQLDRAPPKAEPYPRPAPDPAPELRQTEISATALDRLLGDPYQFYAQKILRLDRLDPLAADPFDDAALRGTLVHDILDAWHKARVEQPDLAIRPFAEAKLRAAEVHPLFWGLWRPRIVAALERFERWIDEAREQGRTVVATETKGSIVFDGVRVSGRADRIDRLADGSLAIVDYKTGTPPTARQVEAGYALQLGVLGLIARDGSFKADGASISGEATGFEYWSLARCRKDGKFGFIDKPLKVDRKNTGLDPDRFLPAHEEKLGKAIRRFINGRDPFTAKENPDYPGYTDYDQLMRLEEWIAEATASGTRGDPT
ncbi:double-strand break repair protein AddB [Erythrobacter sp. JK5]|uniref:double-strand break repair protein AddB n=1 Tax=Erythrobacter sp. JK5 TaxID=2829500 RepID=UPI001BAE52A3|nr:double-strand break repair protein AddB [Erythrobacter sp. JK5]QUL38904.1 double-strand break repair protein AddB [Erythrobacter sp. JK5]